MKDRNSFGDIENRFIRFILFSLKKGLLESLLGRQNLNFLFKFQTNLKKPHFK